MLTREQKLIIDLAYRGAHAEEILFVCLNEFYKEFPASRINSIIKELQTKHLNDRINDLEMIRDVAKERSTYLEAYLDGKLYVDDDTPWDYAPIQLNNVRAILDACDKNDSKWM